MTVKFKFDYAIAIHNKRYYTIEVEKEGAIDAFAYNNSLTYINHNDIKSISKTTDGTAFIRRKSVDVPIETIEEYDDVMDIIRKANLAVDIMHQEKVYIFDDFEVDSDELNVCDSWSQIKDIEREYMER